MVRASIAKLLSCWAIAPGVARAARRLRDARCRARRDVVCTRTLAHTAFGAHLICLRIALAMRACSALHVASARGRASRARCRRLSAAIGAIRSIFRGCFCLRTIRMGSYAAIRGWFVRIRSRRVLRTRRSCCRSRSALGWTSAIGSDPGPRVISLLGRRMPATGSFGLGPSLASIGSRRSIRPRFAIGPRRAIRSCRSTRTLCSWPMSRMLRATLLHRSGRRRHFAANALRTPRLMPTNASLAAIDDHDITVVVIPVIVMHVAVSLTFDPDHRRLDIVVFGPIVVLAVGFARLVPRCGGVAFDDPIFGRVARVGSRRARRGEGHDGD